MFRKNLHGLLNKKTNTLPSISCKIKEQQTQPTQQLSEQSISVNDDLNASLLSIIENNKNSGIKSFGQLFWQEQMKNIHSIPTGRRWHPLLIKWCLYMHHLSSSSYNLLRNSGCIVLPSGRTLRDYTHHINNKPGFQDDVDEQLRDMIGFESLENHQKYVCVVADEMKIKEGLVFNKIDGDLIGFTDLGTFNKIIDKGSETPKKEIATSMFVVMVRGLIKGFNFPYASFPSNHLSGDKIASIVMEATFRLERMGMKVMAHTLDGCSINRKYFRIMSTDTCKSLQYNIYFMSDPPHLIKTTRNCFYNPRRRLEVMNSVSIILTICVIII